MSIINLQQCIYNFYIFSLLRVDLLEYVVHLLIPRLPLEKMLMLYTMDTYGFLKKEKTSLQ